MQQLTCRMWFSDKIVLTAALSVALAIGARGQMAPSQANTTPASQPAPTATPGTEAGATTSPAPSTLRLVIGPGDEIELSVYGVSDLNQRVRVDANGEVSLALVGNVPIAGLTADEA